MTHTFEPISYPSAITEHHWIYFTPVFYQCYLVTNTTNVPVEQVERIFFQHHPNLNQSQRCGGLMRLSEYARYES